MGKTIADSFRDEGRAEGRVQGASDIVLRRGRRKFGEPDSATIDALRAVVDLDRLDRMVEQSFTAESWSDLLSTL